MRASLFVSVLRSRCLSCAGDICRRALADYGRCHCPPPCFRGKTMVYLQHGPPWWHVLATPCAPVPSARSTQSNAQSRLRYAGRGASHLSHNRKLVRRHGRQAAVDSLISYCRCKYAGGKGVILGPLAPPPLSRSWISFSLPAGSLMVRPSRTAARRRRLSTGTTKPVRAASRKLRMSSEPSL